MAVEPVIPGVVKVILDGRLDITGQVSSICNSALSPGPTKASWSTLPTSAFWPRSGSERYCGRQVGAAPRRQLVLLNPVGEVERVLEVTGVTDLMPIYRDSEAAVAAASAHA